MEKDFRFLIYRSKEEEVAVNAVAKDESIRLTQKGMAELFAVEVPAVSKHLANIYTEGELDQAATVSKMEIVQAEGTRNVRRQVDFYNLDAIISVGYRVNSRRATHFRIWATGVLKEYMLKGFVLDDDRLKQGKTAFGKDYFRELFERVRSIRASERRIWQQVTDIFAECSIDYDKDDPITQEFYAMVQNMFHYANTGKTAAEIVFDSADHEKEHMGLTTWKNAPDGRILKSDVSIAKNYLSEKQIRQLERTVSGYFDCKISIMLFAAVIKYVPSNKISTCYTPYPTEKPEKLLPVPVIGNVRGFKQRVEKPILFKSFEMVSI